MRGKLCEGFSLVILSEAKNLGLIEYEILRSLRSLRMTV
jgi:hypothetical protein